MSEVQTCGARNGRHWSDHIMASLSKHLLLSAVEMSSSISLQLQYKRCSHCSARIMASLTLETYYWQLCLFPMTWCITLWPFVSLFLPSRCHPLAYDYKRWAGRPKEDRPSLLCSFSCAVVQNEGQASHSNGNQADEGKK